MRWRLTENDGKFPVAGRQAADFMTKKTQEPSLSYSWSSTPARPKPACSDIARDRTLWALPNCTVVSLPGGRLMLRDHEDRSRVVTSSQTYSVVQHCRSFRTIDEHAAWVSQTVPTLAKHREQVLGVLDEFRKRGLFVSATEVAQRLGHEVVPSPPAPFDAVYVRTCDRPEHLARLLRSLLENESAHGKRHRVVVLDDSRATDNQQRNSAQVDEVATAGLDVEYYGREQQIAFVEKLSSELPRFEQAIDYLLRPCAQEEVFSAGQLWNHMLLLAAGKRFLMLDDDMLCRPRYSPSYKQGIELSDRERDTWVFRSRADAVEATKPLARDPFSEHLQLLGKPLGRLLADEQGGKPDPGLLRDFDSRAVARLCAESPVLLTQCGIVGDPGTTAIDWLYQISGEARRQLVTDEAGFQERRDARSCWIGTARLRVCTETSLLTTLTGFDGAHCLPPTGPRARNEDKLFGALTNFAHPGSVAVEFPWGLLHFPEPERRFEEAQLDRPVTVGSLGFLADVAMNIGGQCLAQGPQARLRYLGETYRMLGEATDADLGSALVENGLHALAQRNSRLQAQVQINKGKPEYWSRDVQRLMKADGAMLDDREGDLIPESEGGRGRAAQIATVRETLRQYGNGLSVWGELWRHCCERN